VIAEGARVSEREQLLSVLWESAAVNEEWRRWIIADAILAAGFGDVAQAKAEALEEAAADFAKNVHVYSTLDGGAFLRHDMRGDGDAEDWLLDLAAEKRTTGTN